MSPLSPAVPPLGTSQDVSSPLLAVAHSAAEASPSRCQPGQLCLHRANIPTHTFVVQKEWTAFKNRFVSSVRSHDTQTDSAC
ncbi:hypothetical protein AMEX_G18733 [Astyanax mexicanus]|uniref:Uncharacterized protein n=1 Tax=Astyanax mexicanus TaxID=7994 RepID=A0A8T2LG29_ASTMX|nr:hypothetical protein AMEX_G18733 [Astyanax mexicanus]